MCVKSLNTNHVPFPPFVINENKKKSSAYDHYDSQKQVVIVEVEWILDILKSLEYISDYLHFAPSSLHPLPSINSLHISLSQL